MAIELSAARETRRSGWWSIAAACWRALMSRTRRERRGFYDPREKREYERTVETWRNASSMGGPW